MRQFSGFIILLFLLSCNDNGISRAKNNPEKAKWAEMCWWYAKPANKYWEGLPVGTGRFAAMLLGGVKQTQIPFNDETLWSGGPYDPNNPKGPEILGQIRKYAFEKDYAGATKEAAKLASIPMSVQHYQPMGILNLEFGGTGDTNVENYRRKLSMDSALVTVSYSLGDVEYKREIFASYPDQVLVARYTASKPGSINMKAWLSSLQPSAFTRVKDGDIVMQGTTEAISTGSYRGHIITPRIKWQARLKAIVHGGNAICLKGRQGKTGDQLQIEKADSVILILAGATNWKSWDDVSADEKARCDDYIKKAGSFSYAGLRERHLKDYMPLFAGCKIDLGGDSPGNLNTTERMNKLRAGQDDPLFTAQYFQYGRYLLLAAAREGTLAYNNHNIWLNDMEGRWQGRWTLNINLEECYWPVESTNLARLNQSLLYFTEQLAEAGKRTAKELYGCRGWVAHHGTDIWFNTAPTDGNPQWATWPMGGAWLLQQLYDHYTYDPDTVYLEKIYPLLRGSAQFFLDFMVTDPATGWLVTCPSTSPENSFYTNRGDSASVSMGSTMDNEIIRRLFRNCLEALTILKTDPDFGRQIKEALGKLPPYQVGRYGQLQEWIHDFKEVEVTHRHLSPLFAFYPDDDISLRKTPELARAVKVVLDRRGDQNKGWSGAWKINQRARLEEPEEAYRILKSMLTDVSIHPRPEDSQISPSFEGNQGIQGVTAGITEMLMQSHSGEISLLPALPEEWPEGAIEGLRARGGFTVNISWSNHRLNHAVIHSTLDGPCIVRTKIPVKILSDNREINFTQMKGNLIRFNAKAGEDYTFVPL